MRLTKKRLDDDSIKFVFGYYECGVIFDKSMTEKDKEIYLDAQYPISVMNKLGQLEDIEEELGIDLITLFKALKNGIWLKDEKDQFIPYHCLLRDDFILVLYEDIYKKEYLLKDYGKTWALTKEELFNGR